MILFNQPYVSDFLRQTIRDHHLPVVITDSARAFGVDELPSAITEQQATERARATSHPIVYAVSESSIGWVTEHLSTTRLPDQINRFKDKARFRRETAPLFPDLFYRELALDELDRFDPTDIPTPFIIKPSVGFFSLGVARINRLEDWATARATIRSELQRASSLFPSEVLNTSRLLIESCITGREFAVDAYYDEDGEPVVLSVLEHLFANETDTSDRVYVTSEQIVRANLERFTKLLSDLNAQDPVRNFAVHLELRVDAQDRLFPIEVNPLRFGGWCTTADLTYRAFGVNPYVCLFEQQRPDWDQLLRDKQGQLFSIIALGNSSGIDGKDIQAFDYDALLSHFKHPIELRRTDHRQYPIFGFVFARSEDDTELQWALQSDLREFITIA